MMDEEFRALQKDYLADLRETIEGMRSQAAGLTVRDGFKTSFPTLLFVAHQLKGSGGTLGFPRISDLARQMTSQLNLFLEEDHATRPTPRELSEKLLFLTSEMEREVVVSLSSMA